MNKKGLLAALLALGLILTGCGGNDGPTTPVDPNKIDRVAGNGESWPEEVEALINKAKAYAPASLNVTIPFINTEFYSAEYVEDTTENIQYSTTVFCENSVTVTSNQISEWMTLFTTTFTDAGFSIDKSLFADYGCYIAQFNIKGNEYFTIEYGVYSIDFDETTFESFDVFYFGLGYIKPISRQGWVGDYMTEWPTAGFESCLGTDIPHPGVDLTGVEMFGGYNTLPLTDNYGKEMLLDCYILWLIGTEETLVEEYFAQLQAGYWYANAFDDDSGYFAMDMLSQVSIEFFFMEQSNFGGGLCIFAYINNPNMVFDKTETWPTLASKLPEYTEEGATLTFYSTSVKQNHGTINYVVVGGCAENAWELYAAQLEAAGWEVARETDAKDPTFEYYYVISPRGDVEAMIYMEAFPSTGVALSIQFATL